MVFILSAIWWRRIRGLWKLPNGRDWLRGKLGLVLIHWIFNLIFCCWVGVCFLRVIYLRPNCGGGNEDNGDLLQNVPCTHCYGQWPQPCSRLPPTRASTGDSRTLKGKSGSVSFGVTAPLSWVLVGTRFFLCHPRVCFPSPVKVLMYQKLTYSSD